MVQLVADAGLKPPALAFSKIDLEPARAEKVARRTKATTGILRVGDRMAPLVVVVEAPAIQPGKHGHCRIRREYEPVRHWMRRVGEAPYRAVISDRLVMEVPPLDIGAKHERNAVIHIRRRSRGRSAEKSEADSVGAWGEHQPGDKAYSHPLPDRDVEPPFGA